MGPVSSFSTIESIDSCNLDSSTNELVIEVGGETRHIPLSKIIQSQGKVLASYTAEAEVNSVLCARKIEPPEQDWVSVGLKVIAVATIAIGCLHAMYQLYSGQKNPFGAVITAASTLLHQRIAPPRAHHKPMHSELVLAKALSIADKNMALIEEAFQSLSEEEPIGSKKARAYIQVIAYKKQLELALTPSPVM